MQLRGPDNVCRTIIMLPLWSLYDPVNEAAVRIGCQSVWHLFVVAGEEWNKPIDQIKHDFRIYLHGEDPPHYVKLKVWQTVGGMH